MSEHKKTPDWPDWRDIEQYRHLLDLDRAGWAWEWLRRRRDYVGETDDENSNLALDARSETASGRRLKLNPDCQWGLCFR